MTSYLASTKAGQIRLCAIAMCFALSACTASATTSQTVADERTQTSSTQSATTNAQTSSPTTESENIEMDQSQTTKAEGDCQRLTEFATAAEQSAWQTVNDNVMGGRSSGGPSFGDGLMVFAGEINTDGGGFSSLRLPLEPDALTEFDRVVVRARPDQRKYVITFDDNIASRDRRVSHRAPLEFAANNEWQEVSVSFSELFPALFGRPVDDLPFDKTLATRMGIMISDGEDGPFRLEVDWINLCQNNQP